MGGHLSTSIVMGLLYKNSARTIYNKIYIKNARHIYGTCMYNVLYVSTKQ